MNDNPIVRLLTAIVIFLVGVAMGGMYVKIQYLEGKATLPATTTAQPSPTAQDTAPKVTTDQIKNLFTKDRITFGNPNSKILFVNVSDPSCPFCHFASGLDPELGKSSGRFQYVSDGGTYTPPVTEMRKLVDQGKAAFVWIYNNGHGNGELASQALYCANEKGKFWDAHDLLMSDAGYKIQNGDGTNAQYKVTADQIINFLAPKVDVKDCLTSNKYANQLQTDQQLAQTLAPQHGTPDFFVNTTNFNGAQDYKVMETVVKPLL